MPMDGLMFHYLAEELREKLVDGRIDKITQPERDEVILTIRNHNCNHALLITAGAGSARLHITSQKQNSPLEPPMFCMLMRKYLSGGRIRNVEQIDADRIVDIHCESMSELGDARNLRIVCEFMGKYSNIILVAQDGRIIDSIRHVTCDISRVREVLPGLRYERPPAHGKIPFDNPDSALLENALKDRSGLLSRALSDSISGLSRQTSQELALLVQGGADWSDGSQAGLSSFSVHQVADLTTSWLKNLPPVQPRLILTDDGMPLDITPFPYKLYESMHQECEASLSEMADHFYAQRDQVDRIQQKSAALRKTLRTNITRCEKKLAQQNEVLAESERMEEYRIKGELLTHALDTVKKGQKSVFLINYYDPECAKIEVPLEEKLSPIQNAQRYFKLYKKASAAKGLAIGLKEEAEEELTYLEGQLLNVEECEDEASMSEIREELEKLGYIRANNNRRQIKKLPPSKPLHMISSTGRDILVGRNNLQNDKLTQNAASLETWLHAKDMPGSHVIIVGEEPDRQTLYEAALLAAQYSKGTSSSLVPVDYTLRKYVKKPSGARPGFVIYTHQHTLYVTPSEENLKDIKRST